MLLCDEKLVFNYIPFNVVIRHHKKSVHYNVDHDVWLFVIKKYVFVFVTIQMDSCCDSNLDEADNYFHISNFCVLNKTLFL